MAYFKISEPNKPIKWIKDIDSANGILTFQKSRNGAHFEDEGFFADSELDYIIFHFKEKYPELEYISIDSEYDEDYEGEDNWDVEEEEAPAMG